MSLVFPPMKVLTGPLMSMKEQQFRVPAFFHEEKREKLELDDRTVEEFIVIDEQGVGGFSFGEREEEDGDGSSESSSIGVPSSSDEEEMEDEVQSKLKDGGLFGSLSSLEESLPIKRGLSNFFAGKSKSFATLSDAGGGFATDLIKPENPFNKRRRVLMSYKASYRRRASCTALFASFPPPLSPELVKEEREEVGEDDDDNWGGDFPLAPLPSLRSSFKNPRSLSLSDLRNA